MPCIDNLLFIVCDYIFAYFLLLLLFYFFCSYFSFLNRVSVDLTERFFLDFVIYLVSWYFFSFFLRRTHFVSFPSFLFIWFFFYPDGVFQIICMYMAQQRYLFFNGNRRLICYSFRFQSMWLTWQAAASIPTRRCNWKMDWNDSLGIRGGSLFAVRLNLSHFILALALIFSPIKQMNELHFPIVVLASITATGGGHTPFDVCRCMHVF